MDEELRKALVRAQDAQLSIADEMDDDDFAFAALGREIDRLRQIEAAARNLSEPYQQGGPTAEFIVLWRLLEARDLS